MTDTMETEVELKVEDLDKYLAAAAHVVEELRDILASHHADLIKCHMEIYGKGIKMDMALAHQDPVYAGRIHDLRLASDNFINAMRGVY
jgi:hypothetical protein